MIGGLSRYLYIGIQQKKRDFDAGNAGGLRIPAYPNTNVFGLRDGFIDKVLLTYPNALALGLQDGCFDITLLLKSFLGYTGRL